MGIDAQVAEEGPVNVVCVVSWAIEFDLSLGLPTRRSMDIS